MRQDFTSVDYQFVKRSTYGLGHCQSPARCWTFPPPDGFPREPRGPLGGKPPLSPPRPPMRPMGPPGPPGPPGPAIRKSQSPLHSTTFAAGNTLPLKELAEITAANRPIISPRLSYRQEGRALCLPCTLLQLAPINCTRTGTACRQRGPSKINKWQPWADSQAAVPRHTSTPTPPSQETRPSLPFVPANFCCQHSLVQY